MVCLMKNILKITLKHLMTCEGIQSYLFLETIVSADKPIHAIIHTAQHNIVILITFIELYNLLINIKWVA